MWTPAVMSGRGSVRAWILARLYLMTLPFFIEDMKILRIRRPVLPESDLGKRYAVGSRVVVLHVSDDGRVRIRPEDDPDTFGIWVHEDDLEP